MGAAAGKLHPSVSGLMRHIYQDSIMRDSELRNFDVSNITAEKVWI